MSVEFEELMKARDNLSEEAQSKSRGVSLVTCPVGLFLPKLLKPSSPAPKKTTSAIISHINLPTIDGLRLRDASAIRVPACGLLLWKQ